MDRTVRPTNKLPPWGVGAPIVSINDGLLPDNLTRHNVKTGEALYVTPGLKATELPEYKDRRNAGEMSIRLKPFSTASRDSTHPLIFSAAGKPLTFDNWPAVGSV